jgi:hypothetical protein
VRAEDLACVVQTIRSAKRLVAAAEVVAVVADLVVAVAVDSRAVSAERAISAFWHRALSDWLVVD